MLESRSNSFRCLTPFPLWLICALLLSGCDQVGNGTRPSSKAPELTNTSPYGANSSNSQTGLGSRTLYRARKGAPRFQISNLQKKSNDRFELDWQRTSSTSGIGAGHYSLVLRFPSQRNPVTIPLTIWNNNSSGKISGHVIPIRFGGPKTSEHALNRGCEMFLADATGLEIYKLSNSITVGGVSELPTQEPPQRRQPTAHSSNQSNSPAQPVPAEKTPVAETGLSPLPANLNIREGIYLYAQLNGDWIPVKVLAREAGGQIKVHWLGFSDSWDTSLKPDQLRLKTSDLKVLAP